MCFGRAARRRFGRGGRGLFLARILLLRCGSPCLWVRVSLGWLLVVLWAGCVDGVARRDGVTDRVSMCRGTLVQGRRGGRRSHILYLLSRRSLISHLLPVALLYSYHVTHSALLPSLSWDVWRTWGIDSPSPCLRGSWGCIMLDAFSIKDQIILLCERVI